MAGNENFTNAKQKINDEFYTQYEDIERQMNSYVEYNPDVFRDKTILLPCDDPEWSNFTKYFVANFDRFGLKKLISTSYAQDKKPFLKPVQLSLLETESPDYDPEKTNSHGKIYTLTRKKKKVKFEDLKWKYLDGDGDFRSDEVQKLCNQSDIIITNPPFSLFREFLAWVMKNKKQFIIIGNQNCITYKEVFPLFQNNLMWFGEGFSSGNAFFGVPDGVDTSVYAKGVFDPKKRLVKFRNCCWFTNVDFSGRHEPLQLMTMADNQKFNKKIKKNPNSYIKYDNYDAIEVPAVEAIPIDYDGVMGVPITFLDKYCPEQFEIIGIACGNSWANYTEILKSLNFDPSMKYGGGLGIGIINKKPMYARILIKHKEQGQ